MLIMVNLGQSVIDKFIKLLLILLFFSFFINNIQGQSTLEEAPIFVKKNAINGLSINIYDFLTNYDTHGWKVSTLGCRMLSGSLQFKVNSQGKIKDISVTGNIPDTLINMIKWKISESECCWIPAKKGDENVDSNFFILPVFIEAYFTKNCKGNKDIYESMSLIQKLFKPYSNLIITPNAYLFYPLILGGQIN